MKRNEIIPGVEYATWNSSSDWPRYDGVRKVIVWETDELWQDDRSQGGNRFHPAPSSKTLNNTGVGLRAVASGRSYYPHSDPSDWADWAPAVVKPRYIRCTWEEFQRRLEQRRADKQRKADEELLRVALVGAFSDRLCHVLGRPVKVSVSHGFVTMRCYDLDDLLDLAEEVDS